MDLGLELMGTDEDVIPGDNSEDDQASPIANQEIITCRDTLHRAAATGNILTLKCLQDLGVDLNSKDEFGKSILHDAARQRHVEIVKWILQQWTATQLCHQDIDGNTALHHSIIGQHVEIVKVLVDANINVNIYNNAGITPLLLACDTLNKQMTTASEQMKKDLQEIVKTLLTRTSAVNIPHPHTGWTPLHYVVSLDLLDITKLLLDRGAAPVSPYSDDHDDTALHIASRNGQYSILSLLLENVELSLVDKKNKLEWTPMYAAAIHGHLPCVRLLASKGARFTIEGPRGATVIDALCSHWQRPLTFFTDLLDEAATTTEKYRNIPYVKLDFRVLAPPGEQRQMAVVSALITALPNIHELAIPMQHPVLEAFLKLKWARLRYFFRIHVAMQICFLISLSFNFIALTRQELFYTSVWRFMICVTIILLDNTLLQLILLPRFFVKRLETWLSLFCTVMTLVIVVLIELPPEKPSLCILHSASITILLAWIHLMLIVGHFPSCGFYALMFSTVLKTVMKVLLAVVWLIIGFALCFSILFHTDEQFSDPWKAFVKTVVMMTGEYEYSSISYPANGTSYSETKFLSNTSKIIFILFVILVGVVVMNLTIGLATSDIQGILKKGHIRMLVKQAEFMSRVERLASRPIFQYWWVPGCLKKLPSYIMINTEKTWTYGSTYDAPPSCISEKLLKKLVALAWKNWDLAQKSDTALSRHQNYFVSERNNQDFETVETAC